MGMVQIKLTKDQIKATSSFKKMNKIIQIMVVKRNNLMQIEHGVNVATNIGLEKWEQQSNVSWANRSIIKDILEINARKLLEQ